MNSFLILSLLDHAGYEKMKKALTAESLKKGIMQASPLAQTDCLEGFHSVLNLFAPKLIAYSYIGMYCRYFHLIIFIFGSVFHFDSSNIY